METNEQEAYTSLGVLDLRPPFIENNRYYLFVRGRWFYAFDFADTLAGYYLKFVEQGYAVTVTYGQEVIFCSPRQTPFKVIGPKK